MFGSWRQYVPRICCGQRYMDNLFQRTTDRLAYLPIWLALPAFVLVLIVWVIFVPVRYWSDSLRDHE